MARLVDIGLPEWRFDYAASREEQQQANDDFFAAVKDRCREVGGDHEFVGEIVKWQRADGYALYAVVNTAPLELVWVDYGDGYGVEAALIRGLNLDDIAEQVERNRRVAALFGGGSNG